MQGRNNVKKEGRKGVEEEWRKVKEGRKEVKEVRARIRGAKRKGDEEEDR